MWRILKALAGRSGKRNTLNILAVLQLARRRLHRGPEAESTTKIGDSPTRPGRWTLSLPTCALLCAVVLVPLVNTPDHLVWFDITPKIAAMLLMVGIASVSIPSHLLHSPIAPRYAIFFPASMIAVAVLSTSFSHTPFLSLGGSSRRRVGLPTEVAIAAFMFL